MSLIKQAEELEFVPKQQLIQMAQNPRGDYPPFLVISETEMKNHLRLNKQKLICLQLLLQKSQLWSLQVEA